MLSAAVASGAAGAASLTLAAVQSPPLSTCLKLHSFSVAAGAAMLKVTPTVTCFHYLLLLALQLFSRALCMACFCAV